MPASPYLEVTARAGVLRNLLAQKGNHMGIAAPLELHHLVAAATARVAWAPVVAAQTPNKAGQLAPAATHPTPPASGSTRALRDFDARLLHLVGDNKLGVSRGSDLAANAAVDRKGSTDIRTSVRDADDGDVVGYVDTNSQHMGAGDGGDSRASRQRHVAPAALELNE